MKDEPYTVEDIADLFRRVFFNPNELFYGNVTFVIQGSKCYTFAINQTHKKDRKENNDVTER